jgi:hypothetical protein
LLQYGDCPNAVPLATIRHQILAGHLMQSWSVSRGAAACLLWALAASEARAAGAELARDVQVDPAPCVAAAASNEDDKSIEVCGALIDNEKTARADRVKALIARGDAFAREDMIDRAIGDYDAAIPALPTPSMPAANSGAGRATAQKRFPISARRSS